MFLCLISLGLFFINYLLCLFYSWLLLFHFFFSSHFIYNHLSLFDGGKASPWPCDPLILLLDIFLFRQANGPGLHECVHPLPQSLSVHCNRNVFVPSHSTPFLWTESTVCALVSQLLKPVDILFLLSSNSSNGILVGFCLGPFWLL